jgi:hypothetical protein
MLKRWYIWVITLVTMVSFATANNIGEMIGASIVQSLISVQQQPKTTTKHYYRQPKTTTKRYHKSRRKSRIPAECKHNRWEVITVKDKKIATNFTGVKVSYDKMGEMTVRIKVNTPLPDELKDGDTTSVIFSFGKKGKRTVSAKVIKDGKYLLVSGHDAVYIANMLKGASFVQVKFLNNVMCTTLKGSSAAISKVETAREIYQEMMPDHIAKAIKKRTVEEHMERPITMASNQLEYSQKVIGIRPKSHLAKADRNINKRKIQYYIPGSEEIGEMWVDWYIDDDNGPMMTLNFIDPVHPYQKKTYTVHISLMPIDKPCDTDLMVDSDDNTSQSCQIVKDLLRINKWAEIARKKGLRRQYTKRVSFIYGNEKEKKSLSVKFKIYENGAMAAQIEEIKYGFPKQFNFTIANALELAKYIENTRKKARSEWFNKTQSKEDIDALFN